MSIFKAISLYNKIQKAIKKSKKLIDTKQDLAKEVREHINVLCFECKEIIKLLPDFRNIYLEIVEIIESI